MLLSFATSTVTEDTSMSGMVVGVVDVVVSSSAGSSPAREATYLRTALGSTCTIDSP